MNKVFFVLGCAFTIACGLHAEANFLYIQSKHLECNHNSLALEGIYSVSGTNPAGEAYTGKLHIDKFGENVYALHWHFDNDVYDFGTGVIQNDVLAVTFQELINGGNYGVQAYKIHHGNKLSGPWNYFGSMTNGFENAKKIETCHCGYN